MTNRYLSNYYKPKSFEIYRGRIIYEFIGIKIYKKYLPTTGDIVSRWRGIKQIDVKKNTFEELIKFEQKTKTYEWRHLFGFVLFIILTFLLDRKLTLFDWFFLSFLNLYINVYPIFLQRYNRIRILKILNQWRK